MINETKANNVLKSFEKFPQVMLRCLQILFKLLFVSEEKRNEIKAKKNYFHSNYKIDSLIFICCHHFLNDCLELIYYMYISIMYDILVKYVSPLERTFYNLIN